MDNVEIIERQNTLQTLINDCPSDKILSATIDGNTHIFDNIAGMYTVQTGEDNPFFKCSIQEALQIGQVLAYMDAEVTTANPDGTLIEVWEQVAR